MESRPGRGEPFDEQAALAELERVREQIQAYRAQRRAVQDEFGRFVKSFKEPQPIVTPDPPRAVTPAHAPVMPASSTPVIPASPAPVTPAVPAPVMLPTPAPATASPAAAAAPAPPVHTPASPASPVQVQAPAAPVAAPVISGEQAPIAQFDPAPDAPSKPSNQTTMLAAAAAVVVLVLGAWMFWPSSSDTTPGTEATPPAAAPAASATPPPAEPAPAAAPTRGTELVTTSAVWLRVIVDGARVMEREVPAGTTIPLSPRESLVVRAGNGAAVRLTLAGEDQGVLGREGFPITRTFTIPAERR